MTTKISEEQKQALRAKYSKLEVRGEGARKISGVALASKNMKRLLSQEFPGVKFSVTCDTFANGNSVYVSWTELQGPEALIEKVNDLIYPFEYGRFDGMTDSESSDADPDRQAFRSLFGGAKYVVSQPHTPTAAEQAAIDKSRLNADTRLPAEPRKTKASPRF